MTELKDYSARGRIVLNKPWLALEGFCPGCEQQLGVHGICTTCKHTVIVDTMQNGDIWVMALGAAQSMERVLSHDLSHEHAQPYLTKGESDHQ